jgi:hypothetical protein
VTPPPVPAPPKFVPGPDSFCHSSGDISFTLHRWKEGTTILLVNDGLLEGDVPGFVDSASTTVYSGNGYVILKDGRGYKWQIETTAAKAFTFRIDGKEYDLSKGTLFVTKIKAKGEPVEVHQLKRDLSAVPFDAEGCRDFLRKDAEVMKLLSPAVVPKKE